MSAPSGPFGPSGPRFSVAPRINHVAMSVPADALDPDGRAALCEFYGDVFGFAEHPSETRDRQQLVLGFHTHDQFLFLIAEDEPMRAPRLDHFGISVATREEFDEIARRCATWRERCPDEVDLLEPSYEDHAGILRLHSTYVRYRLPMMVETQWWEWL